jgi:hypothetical protein
MLEQKVDLLVYEEHCGIFSLDRSKLICTVASESFSFDNPLPKHHQESSWWLKNVRDAIQKPLTRKKKSQ